MKKYWAGAWKIVAVTFILGIHVGRTVVIETIR